MAGFTGLSLTAGASQLDLPARKIRVALSAIILGGGIWSMHFVGMLGLQLPVLFFYDALITLISALVGILIVGAGLILLHFRDRTATTITLAGLIVGAGILAMHYIGMSGMQACRAAYTPSGIILSVSISLALSTLAVWMAYGERTRRNIVFGTLCFAAAVVALHYIAVANTDFFVAPLPELPSLALSNEALAFVVTLAAFAICGGFLLSGATFFPAPEGEPETPVPDATEAPSPAPEPVVRTVPYEQNGRTLFAVLDQVAAFRAEGHYTLIYIGDEKGFCPWSISEAEKRLEGSSFIRAHRSYLINPDLVTGFERKKDSGIAFFDDVAALDKVPVSRSRLNDVRDALGV
ncbi:MAG: LytTR family transcriptional regulator DNA-binding domain-containing protein [Rhodobacteraceae bacterium]|nr:LytTR family transcriptional regulator DNA-binding domain-containing protein [Paracoccaceae bacterium]